MIAGNDHWAGLGLLPLEVVLIGVTAVFIWLEQVAALLSVHRSCHFVSICVMLRSEVKRRFRLSWH